MKEMILFSMLVGSTLFLGRGVSAVTPTISEGTVTLQALTEEEVGPVTPQTTDPEDPNRTGRTGLLILDAVPSFDFKGEGLSGQSMDTLTPTQTENGYEKNVQTTDRRETGAGWSLSLNTLSSKSTGVALKGANITIPVSLGVGTDNTPVAPSIVKSISGIIDPASGFDVGTVMSANVGEGYGTWISRFSGASLNITDGNSAGSYKSTFTWTIAQVSVSEQQADAPNLLQQIYLDVVTHPTIGK